MAHLIAAVVVVLATLLALVAAQPSPPSPLPTPPLAPVFPAVYDIAMREQHVEVDAHSGHQLRTTLWTVFEWYDFSAHRQRFDYNATPANHDAPADARQRRRVLRFDLNASYVVERASPAHPWRCVHAAPMPAAAPPMQTPDFLRTDTTFAGATSVEQRACFAWRSSSPSSPFTFYVTTSSPHEPLLLARGDRGLASPSQVEYDPLVARPPPPGVFDVPAACVASVGDSVRRRADHVVVVK